jgi:hypothetical protein
MSRIWSTNPLTWRLPHVSTVALTRLFLCHPRRCSAVNLPGFSFTIKDTGAPGAALCPANTYNPGMQRQRNCWPCPNGYTTNGLTGRSDISQCGELSCKLKLVHGCHIVGSA